jgi:hypothetical protein
MQEHSPVPTCASLTSQLLKLALGVDFATGALNSLTPQLLKLALRVDFDMRARDNLPPFACISRADINLLHQFTLAQLPRQRVLSSALADNADHSSPRGYSSIGTLCGSLVKVDERTKTAEQTTERRKIPREDPVAAMRRNRGSHPAHSLVDDLDLGRGI